MRLPIRVRLTAWYAAVLAAILIALGAFVVLQLRSDLRADADRRLSAASDEIARAYEIEGREDFHDVAGSVLARPGGVAQLLDRDGDVVAAHGGAGRLDGARYRLARRTVERRGRTLTLVVAEPLAPADRTVDRVLTLFLVGGAAALLLVTAGGWWLARRALRPVARMTAEAEAIGAENLDRRLEVPRARDELARLAHTLNGMLDRVERGVADKQRLVADASHELRAPLTVMRAELDVALADPELDPSARPLLESVREEADGLTRTVGDLLTLAQADEGRLGLVAAPVDLRELAERVGDRFGVRVEGESATVVADEMLLDHALANLVDNARRHGRGEVRIETWHSGGEAGLAVSDDGPGVPAEESARVFERFVRLDTARGRGGSGLGLAICAEVARAHGGRAYVEVGSRFVLALPAAAGGRDSPSDRRQPAAN